MSVARTVILLFFVTLAGQCAAASPRRLLYSFTVRNEQAQAAPAAELLACAPVAQTSFQQVSSLRASLPTTITTDALGNQTFRVRVPPVGPYGTVLVSVQAELILRQTPRELKAEGFLEPEPLIPSRAPQIVAVAKGFREKSPAKLARRCYTFVKDEVRPTGFSARPRGALWALEHRSGDCTEAACLFVALCRSRGLPARVVEGVVLASDAVVQPGSFHDWAEVYLDGAWRVADPQGGRFEQDEQRYLAFGIWTGAGLGPRCRVGGGLSASMDGPAAGQARAQSVACGCGS